MSNYNCIAGRGLERLCALSDGLFAIAMTLIVLEVHVPSAGAIHSEADLWRVLATLGPRAVTYLLSFLTLGIFWVGQQTQISHFSSSDRDLTWIHLGFLAVVTVMPFSTELLAEFIGFRIALLLYWLNIVALGAMLYASWRYAEKAGLVREDVTPETSAAMKRRIVRAQTLYALGALLCLISTGWSIGFIVLVQLNYALGPRLPILGKLGA